MKSFHIIILGLFLITSSLLPVESLGQKKNARSPRAVAKEHHVKPRYVYFPEHNFYYDVQRKVYLYSDGPHWQISPTLPALYARINVGNSLQVALDFNGDRPYRENHYHVERHRHHDHHKAWKKQHKEWEKREKEWAKAYEKRHKKCGKGCRDHNYSENQRPGKPERSGGRVVVDVSF